jgi:5-methylcytosine-specific restriction endonuclease McrA
MKTCSKCKIEKDAFGFGPQRQSKDGLASWCKQCKKELESQRRIAKGIPQKRAPLVVGGNKECLKCGDIKPIVLFPASSRGRMGKGPYCKPCNKQYHKEHQKRPERREATRRATQKYRDGNRARWRFLHRCNMQLRRARMRKVDTGLVTHEVLERLYSTEVCNYCGECTPISNRTCDHVIPISRGGLHHPDNLVMACGSCNSSKGDRLPGKD